MRIRTIGGLAAVASATVALGLGTAAYGSAGVQKRLTLGLQPKQINSLMISQALLAPFTNVFDDDFFAPEHYIHLRRGFFSYQGRCREPYSHNPSGAQEIRQLTVQHSVMTLWLCADSKSSRRHLEPSGVEPTNFSAALQRLTAVMAESAWRKNPLRNHGQLVDLADGWASSVVTTPDLATISFPVVKTTGTQRAISSIQFRTGQRSTYHLFSATRSEVCRSCARPVWLWPPNQ